MTFQDLTQLRNDHIRITQGITLYPYQELVSDRIIAALINNLNVETAEDVDNLELVELAIEFSRQSGKTEAVTDTIAFIMTFVSEIYEIPIHIGIFAPQIEQAKTDFERLKNALRPVKDLIIKDDEQKKQVKERENAKTLVLPNGSSCWIAPVTTTSKPESKTFHLMVFEEAQDIDDKIMKEQIWPIGATTNAPRIYIGTAGTRICYFRDLGLSKNSIKLYFDDIVSQRKKVYEQTGEVKHLIYEKTVKEEIAKHGLESDEIQRPYFGKWLIGTGQFTTEEELETIMEDRAVTNNTKKGDCYVGIDTAKHPDSTVVTVVQKLQGERQKRLLNWLELRGENYRNQFDVIHDFIKRYNVVAIAIDSTGQGDFMPDLFEYETEWQDEDTGLYRVKFSQNSKDLLYRNLKGTIKDLLTTIPKKHTKELERFRNQLLNLQQEYKGQYLSVSHPDDPNAHDDYCFPAGTMVKTIDGDKPIEEISPSDKVWTREGYKQVFSTQTRYSRVITRWGIKATPNHPFITTEGVKRFDKLQESDTIYTWQKGKLLPTRVGSITDTPIQRDGISESIIGVISRTTKLQSPYIDKFTSTITGTFQRVGSYITKITTHWTTVFRTWKLYRGGNIRDITSITAVPNLSLIAKSKQPRISTNTLDQKRSLGTVLQRGWNGIANMLRTAYSRGKTGQETKRAGSYQTVYNLTVEKCHEYLANGILVHNCDSWALAEWAYARWNEDVFGIETIGVREGKKKKIIKDDKGNVVDDFDDWEEVEADW